ncbi:perilipin-2-like isoform X2 [Takifugu rubripes]|uniref:perilipin-2-like isoform X2 n=1 Tax=Takifugu rubripes TaxID=31033 RepID=UPI0011455F72|nr:perilipin-2-like isoform X2 [Takifugu rubripes]
MKNTAQCILGRFPPHGGYSPSATDFTHCCFPKDFWMKTSKTMAGFKRRLLLNTGVDTALSTSESLVDQYLPGTDDERELETQTLQGFDAAAPSYDVRLECLSNRLRQRAYSRAVSNILEARRRGRGLMTELQSPMDLIQYGRKNIQLSSLWRSGSPTPETGHDAQVMESRAPEPPGPACGPAPSRCV